MNTKIISLAFAIAMCSSPALSENFTYGKSTVVIKKSEYSYAVKAEGSFEITGCAREGKNKCTKLDNFEMSIFCSENVIHMQNGKFQQYLYFDPLLQKKRENDQPDMMNALKKMYWTYCDDVEGPFEGN